MLLKFSIHVFVIKLGIILSQIYLKESPVVSDEILKRFSIVDIVLVKYAHPDPLITP